MNLAEGNISEDHIKDACRRILRAKIRAGRIDNPNGPAAYVGVTKNIGSNEHRQIAREAVQKSLVILKNDKVLPLDTNSKVFVTGSHANNTGRPLPITSFIKTADAFVVAWLPGSEGAGVADVLYGKVKPTGKLPHTWPKDAKQIPINVGDGKKGLYPYGYGLTY
ncbi:Glycosyl hydrolase family 3 C-terminal domain-containing protein [Fibrobacter sp. UWOV1]|uniref:glycoside hydrolase family 3 protein n=1 Tax=Fibrobacter sp. UWOV1 TaxID=1896215 RepID=UPI00091696FD|nr:glycoside hydrolase family 3 C-terminal domain-containing protein [Fibrobacter sp. UWOV1]SHK57605.1 Glycosyl hydrolase family 3 C-terminal domain-containing protein [Fibrobacter sp. UWOV1]